MLQTSTQTATQPPETDPVKKLTILVTVTNDSINGFQAAVQVMPGIIRERFSSLEELARFFIRMQYWETMQLPAQLD